VCCVPTDEKHGPPDPGPPRIDRNERAAGVRSIRGNRLQHEQCDSRQVVVLARDDNVADHFRQLHQSPAATSTASTMPTTAASTGQSFIPAAIRAEAP